MRIGEGLDHQAFEVGGGLILRVAKEAGADSVEREARLLAAVAKVSPLPVPEPVFVAPKRGCMAYRKLPGVPLLDLPLPQRTRHAPSIAAALGGLLEALHALPVEAMSKVAEVDDYPMEEWLREAAQTHESVAGHVPIEHRRAVEAFLAQPPPPADYAPALCHNDLGIEHVLVDPLSGAVTGVIDWSDAAITDPERDHGLIYRDLGPAAAPTPGERAVFYARCSVFEDLAYGLETGREAYTRKCLESLAWLFPA